ncbi:MAG: LD-carboxypeptidase [Cyclobacteriaceae bacterium]
MHRRKFLKKASAFGSGLLLSPTLMNGAITSVISSKPPRLRYGDKIGVITPGSALSRQGFSEALENISQLGFEPVPATYANQKYGFLGGTDFQRISDFHEVFRNDEIKGVICARGGYGSGRILADLDYSLIRQNPKVFIGYSDITTLLNMIYQKAGLICFHGPVGGSDFTDFTRKKFYETVVEGRPFVLQSRDGYTIRKGQASGKLAGGNLSLITALTGTKNEINFDRKIVFIEEVQESPYRIDRMLTQLIASGKLKNARGIAFGKFASCDVKLTDPLYEEKFKLTQVLADRCSNLSIPVYYGFDFGHVPDNATLPVGLKVLFDADAGTMRAVEPAVS